MQKNMLASLLAQLKMNFEGRCSSEGYIQPQSITILSYSLGRTNYVKGGIDYEVEFQADVCFPHQGQVFRAPVSLRSKIGIHAELSPIKILIPRDLHIGDHDFETVEVGQDIEFEVADATFKQQDQDIIVIGRLRTSLKPAPLQPLLHAEVKVEIPTIQSQTSEEKTVTVSQVTEEKKKRKLKKPSVPISNESVQVGVDEGAA
jgi:hypothetical protein